MFCLKQWLAGPRVADFSSERFRFSIGVDEICISMLWTVNCLDAISQYSFLSYLVFFCQLAYINQPNKIDFDLSKVKGKVLKIWLSQDTVSMTLSLSCHLIGYCLFHTILCKAQRWLWLMSEYHSRSAVFETSDHPIWCSVWTAKYCLVHA